MAWGSGAANRRHRSAAARPASPTPLDKSPSRVYYDPSMEASEELKAAADEVTLRYLALQGAIEVRNRLILEAHADGMTQTDLAALVGLSQQRINQLVYDDQPEENHR